MPTLIIPAVTASTGTGPTLRTLRRRLADELGYWLLTNTTAQAATGEASRVVLADELRDDEAGYELLGGMWVYAVTGAQAGAQRRVIRQPGVGYAGEHGALMVSRPFDAALTAGVAIEVTSPLPVKRHLGIKGYADFVNEGLARIDVEALIPIVGNGTYSYSLTAYPWLTSIVDTRGIYDTLWADPSQPTRLSPYSYRFSTDGAGRTLIPSQLYSAADTFYLSVVVAADRLVYDGSSWSYTATPGLQTDTWQAAAPEDWVLAFSMVKALQYLRRLTMTSAQMSKEDKTALLTDIQDRLGHWARAAANIKEWQFPRPIQEPSTPMIGGLATTDGWNLSW